MEIKATTNLSDKAIGYILCGAFEGGSNYWLRSAELLKSEITPDPANNVVWYGHDEIFAAPFSFEVGYDDPDAEGLDDDEPARKIINYPEDIQKGLQLMAEKAPRHWQELADEENGNPDAITYDVAMQYIILGDIIYG